MVDFIYGQPFPLQDQTTPYRLLTKDHVSVASFLGKRVIKVDAKGLTLLAEEAFNDVSHLLRPSHLKQLSEVFKDEEASDNDKFVCLELLKNAVISAEGIFPMCQDTGTAIVLGHKGQRVWTKCVDKEAVSRGIFNVYTKKNLRYSQNAPLTLYEEVNTGNNLPAQLEIFAEEGEEYHFLFIAKGAGCSNKTYLYQETKPLFNARKLFEFIVNKLESVGTAACPPYHFAVVVGGLTPESNLKTVKLATAGYLDELPSTGDITAHGIRDRELEDEILKASRLLGVGAQFGGTCFCHDIRVIRLPRHGGSCPVGIGISCSADRNIKAKITCDGIFLEQLEKNPAQFLPEPKETENDITSIDLNRSMDKIRESLGKHSIGTRLFLNGKMIVARDIAHAKFKERLDKGDGLPEYLEKYPLFYAGPAKTPKGHPSGSFGPTTAARMDPYVPLFQENRGSLIMIAKGNRSKAITESCKKHGGFYLGSIGGEGARLGAECITNIELIEYPELGMEAVYMITVQNFPAFIIVDDKGNDFFEHIIKVPFAYSVKPLVA